MPLPSTQLSRVRERLAALKISGNVFCGVVGISPAFLSASLSGARRMDSQTEERLVNLSVLLLELEEAIQPLSLPTTDPVKLTQIVEYTRLNGITTDSIRAAIINMFGGDNSGSSDNSSM
jgi:hypothetical protein